jgi:hypothetical protein
MCIKELLPVGSSNNAIVTIAIGGKYYDQWYENAYPNWKIYCLNHGLGLMVAYEDLISKEDVAWKKPTWQKMLLAKEMHRYFPDVENVCYLDTDILINQYAPNIFDGYSDKNIGLVSIIENIPFNRENLNRKISFLRHTYYDKKYPLDSAILMSINNLYTYHNLSPQNDFACMGLIVFNVVNHKSIMESWFNKYDRNVESITGGGDQTHMNYEIQNYGKITWFDYKFQALWNYEMSMKYPFLYNYGRYNKKLIKECVESSLMVNYFLHFAGSWHESDMWKMGGVFDSKEKKIEIRDYYKYLKESVTGDSKGMIKP